MIIKKVNCCVCSGWFAVYVYFKSGVSACYCKIEKSYGIMFFVCGIKFYVIVYFVYLISSYLLDMKNIALYVLYVDDILVIYDKTKINLQTINTYLNKVESIYAAQGHTLQFIF